MRPPTPPGQHRRPRNGPLRLITRTARTAVARRPGPTPGRAPVLVRTTVVAGLVAALAASVLRVGAAGDLATTADGGAVGAGGGVGAGGRSSAVPAAGRTPGPVPDAARGGGREATLPARAGRGGGRSWSCRVSYGLLPADGAGVTAALLLSDTGDAPIDGWTLRWDFPPGQRILYAWNAAVRTDAAGAAATPVAGSRTIPPGGSVLLAFAVPRHAWTPTPTGFTLDGRPCAWDPTDASALEAAARLPSPPLSGPADAPGPSSGP